MKTAETVLLLVVAVLHLWFLVLEMFLWARPFGRRTFALSAEKAEATKVLAANQGLYNGFLAAGLVLAALGPPALQAFEVKVFFTACVAVAGLYGGLTASRAILVVQLLPGLLALGAVIAAR